MTSNKDILIIFETSVVRNPNLGYGEIDLGHEFLSIKNHIEKQKAEDKIQLALTKFSVDELIKGREEEFLKDLDTLKKFTDLPNFRSPSIDYREFLKGKLKLFLSKNNIILIPYPPKESLYRISKRAIKKEAPFHGEKKHSDYGFKDVMIWESIICFKKIKEFKKIIFLLNDNGFYQSNCQKEFGDLHDCFLIITQDHTDVISEIDQTIAIGQIPPATPATSQNNSHPPIEISQDTRNLLDSNYFVDGITQFIFDNSYPTIHHLEINKGSEIIQEWYKDEEVVGIQISYSINVDGDTKMINIFLNDANGIEDYVLSEN